MGQYKLNIGIIGAGRIAHIHARNIQALDAACVAGVADVDAQRAEYFASTYGTRLYESVDALLEDNSVDAVIICTPTSAHAEQAVQAAEAGKHVLCEKPIAMTLEEADRSIATANQTGVILMVGHVLRFMPEYVLARELLRGEEIGQVRRLYAARMSGLVAEAWQGWLLDERLGLGVLDAQIHDLDFVTWVLGEGQYITSRGWRAPAGGWVHVDSVVVYDGERWAAVESSFAVPPTYPFTMHLRAIGERGTLEFHFQGESYAKPVARRLTLYPFQGRVQDRTPPATDPYAALMHHFVTSVRCGEPPRQGRAEDARAALALALTAQRSLESKGRPIALAGRTGEAPAGDG